MKYIHLIVFLFIISLPIKAQLPLVTDNAGALGKKVFQIEIANEFQHEYCFGNLEKINGDYFTFSYGFNDKFEILFTQGYEYQFTKNANETTFQYGYTDLLIETKWAFAQIDNVHFNVKPGILLATADAEKGFGSGKNGYKFSFLTTIEMKKSFLNFDLEYIRNENRHNENKDLWHFSASYDYCFSSKFHGVLDCGTDKKTDNTFVLHPMFGLIGIYYLINDETEISTAYKHGLTEAETDNSLIIGFTKRF